MKIFSYLFWAVFVPFWFVAVVVPFFSVMFGFDSVMKHNTDRTWTLYGLWVMDSVIADRYYIFMVATAFVMAILFRMEWVFSSKLNKKERLNRQ